MYLIQNTSTNPYFNLALEEYLLRQTDDAYIILWRSKSTIVVGKHQNLHAELKQVDVTKRGLQIARRMSGGGTVYHDLGNLNFSFIQKGEQGKLVNFKQFIEPVVNFLQEIGVNAVLNPRNDITVDGLKVSGNAEHVFKSKVLHHGTLLFNADLSSLRGCLRAADSQFKGRGVPSFRSKVGNIADSFSQEMTIEVFTEKLGAYLGAKFGAKLAPIDSFDVPAIEKLATEKYSTWDWVFGYSPAYELKKEVVYNEKPATVHLKVRKGIVEEATVLVGGDSDEALQEFFMKERLDYEFLCSKSTKYANISEKFIFELFE